MMALNFWVNYFLFIYLLLRLQQSLKVWVLWVWVVLLMTFWCWCDAAVDVSHFVMVALDRVNSCGQCIDHKGLSAECWDELSHVQLPVSLGFSLNSMNTSQHALDLFWSIFADGDTEDGVYAYILWICLPICSMSHWAITYSWMHVMYL